MPNFYLVRRTNKWRIFKKSCVTTVAQVGSSSVTAMRQDLGWDTLQQRRDQARLSMMNRITHQQVDIPAERYLTPLDNRTRGHNTRFMQVPTSFSGYHQSFIPRTIMLWNRLSQVAVSQSTLETFQTQLASLTF